MIFVHFLISLCTSTTYLPLTTGSALRAPSKQNGSRIILVLGGNGFVGSSLVAKLLLMDGHRVTTLNRGRHYFDSGSRIDTHVRRIVCDRENIYSCTQLVNSTEFYDAVVDYSSFYMEDIQVMSGISSFVEQLSEVASVHTTPDKLEKLFSKSRQLSQLSP